MLRFLSFNDALMPVSSSSLSLFEARQEDTSESLSSR